MSLLFADGFEGYASTTAMLQNSSSTESKWSAISSVSSPTLSTTARTTQVTSANSRSLQFSSAGFSISYAQIPASTELIAGCAFYKNTTSGYSGVSVIGFGGTNNNGKGICVGLNASNYLYAAVPAGSAYGNATTNLGTSSKPLSNFVWHYIEVRAKLGTTNGELEIRLDGEVILNLNNINTATGSISSYQCIALTGDNNSGTNHFHDDLYVCDTTGTTNNTFLGPISVYTLMPTAAGSSTQLTPTGVASNWDAVNDVTADDATTYVSTTTTGNQDLYNFENLPAGVANVLGVVVKTRNTMGTSGNRKLKMLLKNGASTVSSALRNLVFGTWTNDNIVADISPDGSAWTPAKVNSTEGGVEAG